MNKNKQEKKERIFLSSFLLFIAFVFLVMGIMFMFLIIQTFNDFSTSGFFILLSFLSLTITLVLCLILGGKHK